MTRKLVGILCLSLLVHVSTSVQAAFIAPDNGAGTVDMPPPGAEYTSPDEVMEIIDGLPAGSTIELDPTLHSFTGVLEVPGGGLGGTVSTFDAMLQWVITGTGALSGFNRFLTLPVSGEWHMGPRIPGAAVQSFDAEVAQMQGGLVGDPDFNVLSFTAGSDFGLPSPGHTTFTELPGSKFLVDSFFDVTYYIDFEGAPGSVLEGMSGRTTATIRLQAEPVPEPSMILLLASGGIGILARLGLATRKTIAPHCSQDR